MFSDGTCRACHRGITSACEHGGFWGGEKMDGGQGEAVRVPFADSTLVKLPSGVGSDEELARRLMPLTDVLPTGHHAAVSAGVRKGSTVAVIGDGAVGLCGVLAAKRLGAERILILGHQADRLKMAEHFGATDTISARGEEATADVLAKVPGGVDAVMECVGTEESLNTAIAIAEPGGAIGYVGVPHHADAFNLQGMFLKNVGLRGGVAPVRSYLDELLADTLAGHLDASSIFDLTVSLDHVPEGFAAMDQRTATKVLVKVA
jgi:threonine dehydrogenase-like Zn-dependent dehydrogenase